jgi:hypothetical protein
MEGLSTEQQILDFNTMYFQSPLYIEDIKPNNIGDILDVYTKAHSLEKMDSFTMLHFSNWLVSKVKEDHSFLSTIRTKETLILAFVVETVYGLECRWYRNPRTFKLEGEWKQKDIFPTLPNYMRF